MIFTDMQLAQEWFEKQILDCLSIGDLHTFCSPSGVLFGIKTFADNDRVVFSLNQNKKSFLLSLNEKIIAQAPCDDEYLMSELITALEIVKKRELGRLKQTNTARMIEKALPLWPGQ